MPKFTITLEVTTGDGGTAADVEGFVYDLLGAPRGSSFVDYAMGRWLGDDSVVAVKAVTEA